MCAYVCVCVPALLPRGIPVGAAAPRSRKPVLSTGLSARVDTRDLRVDLSAARAKECKISTSAEKQRESREDVRGKFGRKRRRVISDGSTRDENSRDQAINSGEGERGIPGRGGEGRAGAGAGAGAGPGPGPGPGSGPGPGPGPGAGTRGVHLGNLMLAELSERSVPGAGDRDAFSVNSP